MWCGTISKDLKDYVRFALRYCSAATQQYYTSCFLWLYQVFDYFLWKLNTFSADNSTYMTEASKSSVLAQLCNWSIKGLICIYLVSWWEVYSLFPLRLWLSYKLQMCPDLTSISPTVSSNVFQWRHRWLLHLIGLTDVLHVLLSFTTEGRQAKRIQDNSKDQFEIDLIMLLTPFILICSMDHDGLSCEFLS